MKKIILLLSIGLVACGALINNLRSETKKLTAQMAAQRAQYEQTSQRWQTAARNLLTSRGLNIESNQTLTASNLLVLVPNLDTNYVVSLAYYGDSLYIELTHRLSEGSVFYGNLKFTKEMEKDFNEITPLIVKDLQNIDGITYVRIDNYTIQLKKGELFQWNQLIDKITRVLDGNLPTKTKV